LERSVIAGRAVPDFACSQSGLHVLLPLLSAGGEKGRLRQTKKNQLGNGRRS
jgi:hypothetical protein